MIQLRNLSKEFGRNQVLKGVSVDIQKGEVFSIIGPSGQGKTTLLRLINMLERPSGGDIVFDGISYSETGGDLTIRRRMGMVFQKPVAFSETVYDNIAKGLKYRKIPRDEIQRRVLKKLDEIGLAGYEKRNATTLSGGEMQRVSLARVMVTEPDLLILDEPTANLDPLSTSGIEDLIRYYNLEYGTTVIMSTHDLIQGQRLADRIAVMMAGRIAQIGDTYEVFANPCHPSVARFIGVQNIFPGEITETEGGMVSIISDSVRIHAVSDLPGGRVIIGIRVEDITLHIGPD